MLLPDELHSWDLDYEEAINLQKKLSACITLSPCEKKIRYVAGGDISFPGSGKKAAAAFVIYDMENRKIVEEVSAVVPLSYPYIPGLLSFREVPPLLGAWKKLTHEPDVVMLDGHGIAHPRRLGLASHFGLWVDKAAIGCAKKVLVGEFEEPNIEKGSTAPLTANGESIGTVLRTRTNVKPVFVSPGHKMDFHQAVEVVLACAPRYKMPEPTRQAHLLANKIREQKINL